MAEDPADSAATPPAAKETNAPDSSDVTVPSDKISQSKTYGRGPLAWMQRVKDWMFKYAERPNALWWLAGFSFIESSFFPIPPDVLLMPIGAANPKRAPLAGVICTAGSVLGAILGFFIGYLIFENLGANGGEDFLVKIFGANAIGKVKVLNDNYGLWMVFIAGLTPIPFKLLTIWSGFWHNQYSLLPFIGVCFLARGLRFMTEAILLRLLGKKIQDELEKRFNFWSILFMILLVGGFLAMKLLK